MKIGEEIKIEDLEYKLRELPKVILIKLLAAFLVEHGSHYLSELLGDLDRGLNKIPGIKK